MRKKQSFHEMIEKQICDVYDDATTQIKKIIKDNDAVMMHQHWDKPDDGIFLTYFNDVDKYLHDYTDLDTPIISSTRFVTHAEIEKFKTETWPKLFAKWKRTCVEADKKRLRLREQIKECEAQLAKLDALN